MPGRSSGESRQKRVPSSMFLIRTDRVATSFSTGKDSLSDLRVEGYGHGTGTVGNSRRGVAGKGRVVDEPRSSVDQWWPGERSGEY